MKFSVDSVLSRGTRHLTVRERDRGVVNNARGLADSTLILPDNILHLPDRTPALTNSNHWTRPSR